MGRSNMISIILVGIYPQKLLVSYLPISSNTHCLFLPHAQYCLPWLSVLCLSSAKTTNSLKTRTQLLVIFLCSHSSLITAWNSVSKEHTVYWIPVKPARIVQSTSPETYLSGRWGGGYGPAVRPKQPQPEKRSWSWSTNNENNKNLSTPRNRVRTETLGGCF